jgi:hypothetical protein
MNQFDETFTPAAREKKQKEKEEKRRPAPPPLPPTQTERRVRFPLPVAGSLFLMDDDTMTVEGPTITLPLLRHGPHIPRRIPMDRADRIIYEGMKKKAREAERELTGMKKKETWPGQLRARREMAVSYIRSYIYLTFHLFQIFEMLRDVSLLFIYSLLLLFSML